MSRMKLKAKYKYLEQYKVVLKCELSKCDDPEKEVELQNKIIGVERFQHEINNKLQHGKVW